MAANIALVFIAASAVVTYFLQLWTGFAVVGWSGNIALVDRRTKPGPYWFVIALQTLLLVIAAVLVAFNGQ